MKKEVKTQKFVRVIFLFTVITAYTLFAQVKIPKDIYPFYIPLDAVLSISPEIIKPGQTAQLNFVLINKTDHTLSNVKIILPSTELDTLETVSARRNTNLPWKSSDAMFVVGDIKSGATKTATVSGFSNIPNTYSVRAWVTTQEGLVVTTNQSILKITN